MRTVVQFIDTLQSGGKERQLFELVKVLSAHGGFQTHVVSMSPDMYFDAMLALPRVQVSTLIRNSRHDLSIFWRFGSMCRQWRPDLITSWHSMPAIYAVPAARIYGIPHITAMIQDAPKVLSRSWRWRSQFVFAMADEVVANCQAGVEAYRAPRRTRIIGTGYDLARLQHRSGGWQQRLGLQGRLVVGMVATFSHYKDQPTFILAALLILAQRRDVVFVLAGSGPTAAACQALIPPDEVGSIRLLGQFPAPGEPQIIEDLVDCLDIGVLATFTEGISNSVVEYMVLCKPVVATHGGGMSELVVDGETGYLVPEQQPAALAARILHLLDNPDLRKKMGQAGRQRVESHFLIEHTLDKFLALYDAVVPPASANKAS